MAPAIGSRPSPRYEVLPNRDVVLRLDGVCILTAARRARLELIAACLDGAEVEAGVEATIVLLERFLETTDFRALRTRHPELTGRARCSVRLHQRQDGTVRWEVYRW